MADLTMPVVARLYTGGSGRRRYRRASVLPGPGEPLVRLEYAKAHADAAIRAALQVVEEARAAGIPWRADSSGVPGGGNG